MRRFFILLFMHTIPLLAMEPNDNYRLSVDVHIKELQLTLIEFKKLNLSDEDRTPMIKLLESHIQQGKAIYPYLIGKNTSVQDYDVLKKMACDFLHGLPDIERIDNFIREYKKTQTSNDYAQQWPPENLIDRLAKLQL